MMRLARPSMRGNTALAPMYETDVAAEPELIENIIPLGQRCSLLELNDSKCRWPIGDPGTAEFFFCGGAPLESAPYCGYHLAGRLPAARSPAATGAPYGDRDPPSGPGGPEFKPSGVRLSCRSGR